jgi:protein arginine kinase activator
MIKCQMCNQNDATVHFKQVVNGAMQEMALCQSCAQKNGFDLKSSLALTDFLFGPGGPEPTDVAAADDIACASCHMRRSDFQRTSRLGCAACYETFHEDIAQMLPSMHGSDRHAGKVPASQLVTARIAGLRQEIKDAVVAQDFERAAALRDEIRALKSGAVQAEAGVTT